ncbi:lipopolysaccharide transport periplasmic protein LptA [Thalassolituus sp. LLYu03]|uniref:lipopolysaccharide transport periplasmic protein LptA n=1 Tax=Thalassolituus sp. LLYu03 TaxID=3421656 RepID=UPI003D2BCAA1
MYLKGFSGRGQWWLLSTLLLAQAAQALPDDTLQEMTILSDRAEIDRKTGVVIYEGHVVLTQGTLRIESERLTIIRTDDTLEKAIAEGKPARYQQQVTEGKPLTKASGNRIDYLAVRREVTVKGNALLEQDGNRFSGDQLLYDMSKETVTASGGTRSEGKPDDNDNRIRMVIQPQNTPAQTAPEAEAAQEKP